MFPVKRRHYRHILWIWSCSIWQSSWNIQHCPLWQCVKLQASAAEIWDERRDEEMEKVRNTEKDVKWLGREENLAVKRVASSSITLTEKPVIQQSKYKQEISLELWSFFWWRVKLYTRDEIFFIVCDLWGWREGLQKPRSRSDLRCMLLLSVHPWGKHVNKWFTVHMLIPISSHSVFPPSFFFHTLFSST